MSTTLKKTVIKDENGNDQIVYVAENTSKEKFKENITIAYFVLGTVVLSMSVWMMYKKFKK